MSSQIPGQYINSVGGVLIITGFQGTTTPEWTDVNTLPADGGPSYWLDCLDWRLKIEAIFDDVTGTGSYGAVNRDQTAEDCQAEANVVVDQRYPPDMLVKYGFLAGKGSQVVNAGNSQFGFNLGVRAIFVQGCGTNYPSDKYLDWYWCPSVKLFMRGPVIDAGNKKDVRMPLGIRANARVFKMPAEYNVWTDYRAHLVLRGQTF
jgi:hypothetical protein